MPVQRFGRYIIQDELGNGTMSRVYLAHDPQVERDVAIKVLVDAHLEDAVSRRRFQREVTTVARIDHDGIVPVYDAGEHQGQPYLVMRYLSGGSLRDRLQSQTPMPLEEARRVITRLAEALDAAHAHNIIHRDIKPANVLLDESGLCYLTDFSLARIIEHTMTTTAVTTGTPHYMAPEQWQGLPVDPRTDIYQLGVMLFEMLTGRLPFAADQLHTFITQHLHDPIPSAHQLNPALPLACDGVLEKAMAKSPEARFQSASEIAIALEQALASGNIGRYQIRRVLTTGGMGTVYLAYDPQIERDVAIKVIKNRRLSGDAKSLEAFRREARIIAGLEHDAIVPIYDFGEHQGKPFLVMRHMVGGSLDEQLKDHRPMPLDEVCQALDRLAAALDYAHLRGVLHCDIKPANILLGKTGSAYLSDFGLARDEEGTSSLGIKGSPPYMAPEQWQGQGHATARTDVYQLGITLFEMLTGQRPYGGTRSAAFMYKHLLGPIPSACELNPALPAACDQILEKALAKEPAERFATAGQLSKAFAETVMPTAQTKRTAKRPTLPDTKPQARRITETSFWGWPPGWVWVVIVLLPLAGYLLYQLAGGGPPAAEEAAVPPPTITVTTSESSRQPSQEAQSGTLVPVVALVPSDTPTSPATTTSTSTAFPTQTPTPSVTSSATVASTSTSTPSPTPPIPQLLVNISSLNLREGPGANYRSIGYLYENDVVTVLAQTNNQAWYLVQTELGDVGWISADYTTAMQSLHGNTIPLAQTIPAPPPTATATPTPTQTATSTPAPVRDTSGGGDKPKDPPPTPTVD